LPPAGWRQHLNFVPKGQNANRVRPPAPTKERPQPGSFFLLCRMGTGLCYRIGQLILSPNHISQAKGLTQVYNQAEPCSGILLSQRYSLLIQYVNNYHTPLRQVFFF